MRCLLKTLYWLAVTAVVIAAAAVSLYLQRSDSLRGLVAERARLAGIDPRLALALVQAGSGFQPAWSEGDRFGLLAVSAADLADWNARTGADREPFDLFDPEFNLTVGLDRFARLRAAWSRRADPEVWALAEWFAGAEAARRWSEAAGSGATGPAAIPDALLRAKIDRLLACTAPCPLALHRPGGRVAPAD